MRLSLVLGVLIFTFSLVLAFTYHYIHFYEFTLVGLFLLFYGFMPDIFSKNVLVTMYRLFFLGGLFGDLLLGLSLTKLWHYNYASILDYIPLYLIVYPLGGIVLVQAFALFEKLLVKKERIRLKASPKILKNLSIAAAAMSGVILLLNFQYNLLLSFVLIFFAAFFYFNYRAEVSGKVSLFSKFLNNPAVYIIVALLASYSQALLHEFPNLYASVWVYTNWPFNNVTFIGVPVIVFFIGWVGLTILPATVYYRLK